MTRLNTCFNPKCHEKQDITYVTVYDLLTIWGVQIILGVLSKRKYEEKKKTVKGRQKRQ